MHTNSRQIQRVSGLYNTWFRLYFPKNCRQNSFGFTQISASVSAPFLQLFKGFTRQLQWERAWFSQKQWPPFRPILTAIFPNSVTFVGPIFSKIPCHLPKIVTFNSKAGLGPLRHASPTHLKRGRRPMGLLVLLVYSIWLVRCKQLRFQINLSFSKYNIMHWRTPLIFLKKVITFGVI